MISADTNVLFASLEASHPSHRPAQQFLRLLAQRSDVVISEFVLLELYNLLRNPTLTENPLLPAQAAEICQMFRMNPLWQVVAVVPDSRAFHDRLWERLAEPNLARRRAYDIRIGLSLVGHGVDEFATANVRDFQDLGFKRVWNPLVDAQGEPAG